MARVTLTGGANLRGAISFTALCAATVLTTPAWAEGQSRVLSFSTSGAECKKYDALNPVTTTTPFPSVCQTSAPELGGWRERLYQSGWGVRGYLQSTFTYDAAQDNVATTQSYNGQEMTAQTTAFAYLMYDLSRLGFAEGARFTTGVQSDWSTYEQGVPRGLYISELSLYSPFAQGRVEAKIGFAKPQTEFYGAFRGGSLGQGSLGPQSNILIQAGVAALAPAPYLGFTFHDSQKKFYGKVSVSRSMTPLGVFENAKQNRSGLQLSEGGRPVYVGEVGWRQGPANGGKSHWIRAGAVHNTTDYQLFNRPLGEKKDNQAFYAVADIQLTQSSSHPAAAPLGWYFSARAGYAPEDRNVYTKDAAIAFYKIGTFASRPTDLFSLGVSKNWFSEDARAQFGGRGLTTAASATTWSASYAYELAKGTYLNGSLSRIDNPTFAPKRNAALQASMALTFSF